MLIFIFLLVCVGQSADFFFTWIISFDPHHHSPSQVLLFILQIGNLRHTKIKFVTQDVQLITGGETKIWANSNFRPSALSRNANNGRWTVHQILPRKQFGGRLEISHTLKLNPVLMLVLLLTSMWAPDFALFLWTPMVCPKK